MLAAEERKRVKNFDHRQRAHVTRLLPDPVTLPAALDNRHLKQHPVPAEAATPSASIRMVSVRFEDTENGELPAEGIPLGL